MAWTTATTRATGFLVTAAVWNAEHVDNMNFLKRVNYNEYTSSVSVTGTSAVQIIATNPASITYEAVPHLFEFYAVRLAAGSSGSFNVIFRDSTSDLGVIIALATSAIANPGYVAFEYTPTAAPHSFNFAGINGASQTSTAVVGVGGAGNNRPGFIRVTRVPT